MAAKVEVVFAGDTQNLDRAFTKTRGEADRMGNSVAGASGKAGGALGKLGGIAKGVGVGIVASIGVDAVGAMFDFGMETLKAFETIETGQKRAETVFGNSVGMVRDFAANIDNFMGLSTNQVVALTASIGDILVPMGFARDRAAELSTQMVDLATKLSIASGVPIEQAINATTAAMVGEYDSLKSLGVQLDAATVKSLLAANGQANLTGEAAKQAEAEAVLKEILRQTTDAQAQANAKMAEGGNKSAELASTIANLKDKLAVALGPALQDAAAWVGDFATALFDADANVEGLNPDAVAFAGTVRDIANAVADLAGDLRSLWNSPAGDALRFLGGAVGRGSPFGRILDLAGMANGGTITGPTVVGERGPELLMPGQGGGTVVPHGKAGYGAGGTTVIVNMNGAVMAEHDLVEAVRRGLGGAR